MNGGESLKPIEPPDSFHLKAAMGWMDLGDLAEAAKELDQIAAELQQHYAVLEARWRLCAGRRDWPAALSVADHMMETTPQQPGSWLNRAYATRRSPGGSLQAA